jgi:hypothetical protein
MMPDRIVRDGRARVDATAALGLSSLSQRLEPSDPDLPICLRAVGYIGCPWQEIGALF